MTFGSTFASITIGPAVAPAARRASQSRERCEIAGGAHRDGLGADGPADRGEVGVGELGQVDGVPSGPKWCTSAP